ncbi:hypothetical protein E2562_027165 [Oryza meyeriana var. granulata]|uniref:Transposase MuDR plant domain-containing protein n=1 Tax=Oryza meyeriana var. granulata TaxID=110450 RepID=A0A6G1EQ74_9ORYZ|nr:hypothetical protein E2562_027165 [Oryza meyeriana var. granulata]
MECTWHELVIGLDGEPDLSFVVLEPDVGVVPDGFEPDPIFIVLPDGVVEPIAAPAIAARVVDWDTLEIPQRNDDEGRLEIVGDDQFYELLGLRAEDEKAEKDRESATNESNLDGTGDKGKTPNGDDTSGAAILVDDAIPGERVMAYNPNNPCMDVRIVYPSMEEFRLAMRQFAINKEFELDLVKTDPSRYIGGCKVEGCPWHIVGHRQPDMKIVMMFRNAYRRSACKADVWSRTKLVATQCIRTKLTAT